MKYKIKIKFPSISVIPWHTYLSSGSVSQTWAERHIYLYHNHYWLSSISLKTFCVGGGVVSILQEHFERKFNISHQKALLPEVQRPIALMQFIRETRNSASHIPNEMAQSQAGAGSIMWETDILALKHDSSIFRQSASPESGLWQSQASSPWSKQHRA